MTPRLAPTTVRTVRHRPEHGSGLLSTTIGVGVMIAMLGFAANVTLGLWTRTTVDAVAYDAARRVATAPAEVEGDPAAQLATEQIAIDHARETLGTFGEQVELEFEPTDPDRVVLHVRSPGVGLLPRLLGGGAIVGEIDRRIVVRREGGR